jgi:mRNA interferase MazF
VSFERFTVVRVPFPFTDRNATKNRPALVLSDTAAFNPPSAPSVRIMITSQGNAPWPLDCPIADVASVSSRSTLLLEGKA